MSMGLLLLATAAAAAWGWGWMMRRGQAAMPGSVPMTIAIGLAVVVFLGGAANLLHCASPVGLTSIWAAGCALAVVGGWRERRQLLGWRPTRAGLVAAVPLVLAVVLVLVWFTPPAVFNVHDDLEKYLAQPVRMLAHGTLRPNPLGSLGAETLGGQALLQAMLLAYLPIEFSGTVDWGLGFLLFVALAVFGRSPAPAGIVGLAAGACALAINPQVVNTSSLFTGAALILAAILLTGGEPREQRWPAHVLGLLYAGLIALKTSHAAFVVLHLVMLAAAAPVWGARAWRTIIASALWMFVFLAPWLLLHRSLYLAPAVPRAPLPPAAGTETPSVFSAALNGYGSTLLHYTALAIFSVVVASLAAVFLRRQNLASPRDGAALMAAGFAAGAGYFLIEWIGGPRWFGSFAAARYATPALLAFIPAFLVLGHAAGPATWRVRWQIGGLVLAAALVVAFWPSLVSRVREGRELGTPLAYLAHAQPAARADFVTHNRHAFSEVNRTHLRALQDFVPAGQPFAAWVSTPFQLDFARNEIFTIDPAGLAMRWTRMPTGIEHVLLQYRGFAVRSRPELEQLIAAGASAADRVAAARSLEFLEWLSQQAASGRVLYNDGTYVLIRLPSL